DSGILAIFNEVDLAALVEAKALSGLSATDAAKALFGVDTPGTAQVERVRPKLNAKVRYGQLISQNGQKGGDATLRGGVRLGWPKGTDTSVTTQPADQDWSPERRCGPRWDRRPPAADTGYERSVQRPRLGQRAPATHARTAGACHDTGLRGCSYRGPRAGR